MSHPSNIVAIGEAASRSTDNLKAIAKSVLAGRMDNSELSHWSWLFWNRGDFMHRVELSKLAISEGSMPLIQRYAGTDEVAHRILYGKPGKAGCVLVKAPPEHPSFQGDFNDLLVPLHSHPTDHIALVVGGGGTFLIRRQVNDDDVILMGEAGPGTILFYPAGIPHTFISGVNGIHVASAQAEYEPPSSVRFADMAPDYLNTLPRLEYAEYLRRLSL